jgi:O-antigen/teichoic acid export membrane protein
LLLQKVINRLFSYIKSNKDMITIFVGDFVSKGFTFFVNIILLKIASPEDFGLFALYITYLGLGAQFADLGINQGVIKYFSLYKSTNISKAHSFIDAGLKMKIIIALALSIIYYFLSFPTAEIGYKQSAILVPLAIAAIGVFGQTLLEFIQSVLQAKQNYSRLAFIKVTEGSLKFGGILILVLIHRFSIILIYWLYALVPAIIFLLGLKLAAHKMEKTFNKQVMPELFHFSKWLFLSGLVTMFMARLDILMLSFFKSDDYASLGIYSAGLKLGIPLLVATGSMITVFYPKAMEIKTFDGIKKYVIKTLKTTVPLSILFLLFWFMIEIVIPKYFGNYVSSLPVFRILLFAYMFVLLGNPITVLLLTINKQKIALYINIFQLIINIFLNLILYSWLDMVGVALGTLLTFLVGGIVTFAYLYRYVQKNKSHNFIV